MIWFSIIAIFDAVICEKSKKLVLEPEASPVPFYLFQGVIQGIHTDSFASNINSANIFNSIQQIIWRMRFFHKLIKQTESMLWKRQQIKGSLVSSLSLHCQHGLGSLNLFAKK